MSFSPLSSSIEQNGRKATCFQAPFTIFPSTKPCNSEQCLQTLETQLLITQIQHSKTQKSSKLYQKLRPTQKPTAKRPFSPPKDLQNLSKSPLAKQKPTIPHQQYPTQTQEIPISAQKSKEKINKKHNFPQELSKDPNKDNSYQSNILLKIQFFFQQTKSQTLSC